MMWSDYWGALGTRQRMGLFAGIATIVVASTILTVWLLRDPYVTLATGLDADRLSDLALSLERAKLSYRVAEHGDALSVPRSQLGKAHAAAAASALDVPTSVGLELFKETDFSSTDFAQRINYQRALQGELTRTIQTIAGVRSARVHVILPDTGLFKRNAAKATAAVSVTTQPDRALTRAQVAGIQRLVAASVPEIGVNDVVVLDQAGNSLTRASDASEGEPSAAQLDLKRQVDQYYETKLARLLQELAPAVVASLSVDVTLDEKQLRVTTEEPIAARGPQKDPTHAAGVLIKERQSQRRHGASPAQTDGYADEGAGTDWEYEYKVGNRVEQTLSAPGAIRRISVAVVLRGTTAGLSAVALENLVAHAVGVDRARGDSVSVLLLPAAAAAGTEDRTSLGAPISSPAAGPKRSRARTGTPTQGSMQWDGATLLLAIAAIGLLAAAMCWWVWVHATRVAIPGLDDDDIVMKVRQWLAEGQSSGRS